MIRPYQFPTELDRLTRAHEAVVENRKLWQMELAAANLLLESDDSAEMYERVRSKLDRIHNILFGIEMVVLEHGEVFHPSYEAMSAIDTGRSDNVPTFLKKGTSVSLDGRPPGPVRHIGE